MKYKVIKSRKDLFPIEKMCEVLEVGSSGYYKWKRKTISNKTLIRNEIKQQITDIYFASKRETRFNYKTCLHQIATLLENRMDALARTKV
jgi:hypothetical protein